MANAITCSLSTRFGGRVGVSGKTAGNFLTGQCWRRGLFPHLTPNPCLYPNNSTTSELKGWPMNRLANC